MASRRARGRHYSAGALHERALIAERAAGGGPFFPRDAASRHLPPWSRSDACPDLIREPREPGSAAQCDGFATVGLAPDRLAPSDADHCEKPPGDKRPDDLPRSAASEVFGQRQPELVVGTRSKDRRGHQRCVISPRQRPGRAGPLHRRRAPAVPERAGAGRTRRGDHREPGSRCGEVSVCAAGATRGITAICP